MTVQEVLDEIVQIRILEIRILTMNQVNFLSQILLLWHMYILYMHIGVVKQSEGSDLAPVSDVEMDVDENYQDFTHPQNPLKLGGK